MLKRWWVREYFWKLNECIRNVCAKDYVVYLNKENFLMNTKRCMLRDYVVLVKMCFVFV